MGNEQGAVNSMRNPFYQPDSSNITTKQLLSNYIFKSSYYDPYFKECKILEHKQNGGLLIYKQLHFETEEQMQAQYDQFEKRREKFRHPNVIVLRQLIRQSTEGLLQDQHKLILLFDYILIDLRSQLANRMKQNKNFTNEQLGNILVGVIKGYSSLEKQGIANDKIRLSNIYFGLQDQSPIVKVVDRNLFPSLSNLDSINKNQNQYDDIFLSPEEILQNFTSLKSGVYSLGVSLLEICLLNHSMELYDYNESRPEDRINLKEVDERLNIVKNKYPLGYFYIIRQMLERSSDHRPSFQKLQEKLPTNLKNPNFNMNLSVIPKSNKQSSKYIKSTAGNMQDPLFDNRSIASSKIIPQIIPREQRSQAILTSQYRPLANSSLNEVNQVYTNGNSYKGQKNADNQRHGKGKYIYADGSHYYGDWYKNKMCGSGVLYYSDNEVQYDGQWKDDLFQGRGTLYGRQCDWIKYEGQFKAGKMQGYGTMKFYDGSVFTGGFRNDRPHGKGRMIHKDGQQRIGTWDNGKLLK